MVIPVPFTMMDASVDTSNLASALDLGAGKGPGGTDAHPGGPGYSGQFLNDPATLQTPPDLGLPLRGMNPDEKVAAVDPYINGATVYRDVTDIGYVSPGDIRLTDLVHVNSREVYYPAGTVVQLGDRDLWWSGGTRGNALNTLPWSVKHDNADGNLQMDPGERVYKDVDNSGTVSYGDLRLFWLSEQSPWPSTVEDFALPGGVSRYPDFLNTMFPPDVVGQPLARQWGGRMVLISAVSLNIVTFRPGQLPGYPATLGYPNVVILLNPVAPVDANIINLTSDLCSPLSLTSTNLGFSQDNPATQADEGGFVRLTNPKSEKDHTFTLITTSQPDADDDGIENMLDTCPLTPNTQDRDGRDNGEAYPYAAADPDGDALDGACDPAPNKRSPMAPFFYEPDEDVDNYANRADNCATAPNGIEVLGGKWVISGAFEFFVADYGDLIGPSNQTDTDGDDIGDACEGSESGGPGANLADQQCVNATDDDGDGAVNDGCPANAYRPLTKEFLHPDSVIASSQYNSNYPPQKAFDGLTRTSWCSNASDTTPFIEAQFNSPQTINTLDVSSQWAGESFKTGTITMSNGFSQGISLNATGWTSFTFPTQTGVTWVRFTSVTKTSWDACFSEFELNPSILPEVLSVPETGDQCNNATDDDGDGLVNDGCPAVDPGDYAKTHITGEMQVVTLTNSVSIFKYGVKLVNVAGPDKIKDGGARSYSVAVSNLSGSDPVNAQVALRVVEGCARVNGVVGQNTAVVALPAGESGSADFTVDFTGCTAGEYTVQADACQGGDAAPAGFFGSGACPGDAGWGNPTTGAVPLASATASSEAFGSTYSAAKAIDGNNSTLWCTAFAPGTYIETALASTASVDQVNINDSLAGQGYAFTSGTLSFSNGYSQDVTLTNGEGSFSVPAQDGVTWVRFTAAGAAGSGIGCVSELQVNGSWLQALPDPNVLDDAPMAELVEVGTP